MVGGAASASYAAGQGASDLPFKPKPRDIRTGRPRTSDSDRERRHGPETHWKTSYQLMTERTLTDLYGNEHVMAEPTKRFNIKPILANDTWAKGGGAAQGLTNRTTA